MEPHLGTHDKSMFYKTLDRCKVYFEYGCGGSTYQASIRNMKIYSVESDIFWQNKLKQTISSNNIKYIFSDIDTKPNTWGHPGINATNEQKINYSNHILNLTTQEQKAIDIVFIDGRFRVSCCLKCYDVITDNCVIAFDDFFNRPHYHIVLAYFDVIEKTEDNRMAILKKKQNASVPKEIIAKYELIQD